MTKWDLSALEAQIRDLEDLVAKVREVNAAQAEQLRKAQEKIRATALRELQALGQAHDAWEAQKAAEAERDNARRHMVPISEDGKAVFIDGHGVVDLDYRNESAGRAWNEALEAAVAELARHMRTQYGIREQKIVAAQFPVIRSLAKEAGE